jgi:hypothetical protein
MGSGCIIPSVHQTMFGSDFFVSLRRQKRQIEPFPHLLRFPPEPFVGAAMLGPVIAKACRPKLGNPGHMNEKIDREVAVSRSGEFVGDIAGNPQLALGVFLASDTEQFSKIVEQAPPRRIAENVRSGIEPGIIRLRHARVDAFGKFGRVESDFRHYFENRNPA